MKIGCVKERGARGRETLARVLYIFHAPVTQASSQGTFGTPTVQIPNQRKACHPLFPGKAVLKIYLLGKGLTQGNRTVFI